MRLYSLRFLDSKYGAKSIEVIPISLFFRRVKWSFPTFPFVEKFTLQQNNYLLSITVFCNIDV